MKFAESHSRTTPSNKFLRTPLIYTKKQKNGVLSKESIVHPRVAEFALVKAINVMWGISFKNEVLFSIFRLKINLKRAEFNCRRAAVKTFSRYLIKYNWGAGYRLHIPESKTRCAAKKRISVLYLIAPHNRLNLDEANYSVEQEKT